MFRRACLTAAVALPLTASAALAQAGGWDRVWERLESWDGADQVVVAAQYENPYAVPAFQQLVNGLLDRGFTVLQSQEPENLPEDAGLHAELRETDSGPVVAVTRRSNGAIVALAPVSGGARTASGDAGQQATGEQRTTRERDADTTGVTQPARKPRRLDVDGHPRRVAVTSEPGERLSLALLYRNRVTVAALERGQFVRRASYEPESGTGAGLYVGTGDVNGDGRNEVAATWGQTMSLNKGKRTRVDSRVLGARGLDPVGGRYGGFLRIVDESLYGQQREDTETFAGPVERLRLDGGSLTREAARGVFSNADIYQATPISDGTAVVWTAPGRLQLSAAGSGAAVSASPALGLGEMQYPQVLTLREDPEIISGPEADYGTDYDTTVPLQRRVREGPGGGIYTIERKRSPGVIGLTSDRGKDRVVRLSAKQRGLREAGGFSRIDWFILDFDLIELQQGEPAAVVLANRSADGSSDAAIFLMGFPES